MTKIAVATDFAGSTGDPEMSLRALSEAGFTSLHWCHHWCDDFLYTEPELAHIKSLLKRYGLTLLDIHGSNGEEKNWWSPVEYCRKAGVELVANRIRMLKYLEGTGVLMMHIPAVQVQNEEASREAVRPYAEACFRSIDDLMPLLEETDSLIAVENMWSDNWEIIEQMLDRYPANRVGLCYDSGHANANTNKRMDSLEKNAMRLEALHLHDNNGEGDQHQPPFYGTVDWDRLAKIIAKSAYSREISFELSIANTPWKEENPENGIQPYEARLAFAKDAYERCLRFVKMVDAARVRQN